MTESPTSIITCFEAELPPLQQELQAFKEVLDIAREDLNFLLTCTHLPEDGIARITHERKVIADLEWLVYDASSKIAMRELAMLSLN